jgi:hypothetical protein
MAAGEDSTRSPQVSRSSFGGRHIKERRAAKEDPFGRLDAYSCLAIFPQGIENDI